MLNKIGLFTFLEATLLTWLVATCVPPVCVALSYWTVPVDIFSFKVPFLYVLPAGIVALLARIFRLHDKLSDAFGVRRTFDVYRVLTPLAGAVGVPVSSAFRQVLIEKRKLAMQRTFYAYASFEEPKISKALVLSLIDAWTWYWVLLELIFLLVCSVGTLLFFQAYKPAAYLLAVTCALAIVFSSVFSVCGAKADHQIDEIVSDAGRTEALRQEFAKLK